KLVMSGVSHKDCYTGEETQSKRGILSFTYPMENGVVPSWDDTEKPWVRRTVFQSIVKCRECIQSNILRKVLLLGGSTLFQGFKERLLKELQTGVPNTTHVKVNSPQDRMYSMWVGASILASLRTFRNVWVTREDYNEVGPTALQRKSF
uniref:Uncharacterized protein n=1 Tax=Bubo bubo TaxID=30461 RepID=A0A8C0I852_BUBBB